MFRRGGGGGGRAAKMTPVPVSTSTGNEVPVEGVVRVTKVDRIQSYNLVSRPSSVYHAVSPATSVPVESLAATSVPVESLAVSVASMFRCSGGGGDRAKMTSVPVSTSTGNEVPVEGVVRVKKVDRIQAYNLVSRPSSVHHAVSPATSVPVESMAVSVASMFRRSGGGGGRANMTSVPVTVSTSTGNELPVEGVVRVAKVDRIQAYNLVSRPSVYHAVSPATSVPVENLAVSVVRVGDVVDDEHDGFVSVSVS